MEIHTAQKTQQLLNENNQPVKTDIEKKIERNHLWLKIWTYVLITIGVVIYCVYANFGISLSEVDNWLAVYFPILKGIIVGFFKKQTNRNKNQVFLFTGFLFLLLNTCSIIYLIYNLANGNYFFNIICVISTTCFLNINFIITFTLLKESIDLEKQKIKQDNKLKFEKDLEGVIRNDFCPIHGEH